MSEPQVTVHMPLSVWRQIVNDLENHYGVGLDETEVGSMIIVESS
jgi:hypothetical protein